MRSAVSSLHPFPSAAVPAAPSLYVLHDLGTYTDGSPFLPVALSDGGDIAVSAAGAQPAGIVRGFLLTARGTVEPAGIAFGHPPVTCLASNGLVAGTSGTAPRALLAWSSDLGIFGEDFWPGSVSVARGINAAGHVVGNVLFDAGDFSLSRAFVLTGRGQARLVTPPEGGTTFAVGINDAGTVVFNAAPLGAPPGRTRAWCLHHGDYEPVPGLGGDRAWATAVTPAGRIAGHSVTADGATRAFLHEHGATLDLGTLGGGMSLALAANDRCTVVGCVRDPGRGSRAFRWTPETGCTALDELVVAPAGWSLEEAVGIGRDGTIVGRALRHGEPRGFVLRPAA